MTMKCQCLCGSVSFELVGEIGHIYKCHCSLCRMNTGSSNSAALIIEKNQINWLAGNELINSFQLPTGYTTCFCKKCGSPVPNEIRNSGLYWIPAGLLSTFTESKLKLHLYCNSKPEWDMTSVDTNYLDEGVESIAALKALIRA